MLPPLLLLVLISAVSPAPNPLPSQSCPPNRAPLVWEGRTLCFGSDAPAVSATSNPGLCVSAGKLVACSDPISTPLCWDSRNQTVVECKSLPADKDGSLKRALWNIIPAGADIVTTGWATSRGAQEGNKLVPTPEIRWGAKVITVAAAIGLEEVIARKYHKPKLATWIARGIGAGFLGIAAHNVYVGSRNGVR